MTPRRDIQNLIDKDLEFSREIEHFSRTSSTVLCACVSDNALSKTAWSSQNTRAHLQNNQHS